jgi:hypothetical protein
VSMMEWSGMASHVWCAATCAGGCHGVTAPPP